MNLDTPVSKQNIELTFLAAEDYEELREAMISAYLTMPGVYWTPQQIKTLVEIFPEGQIVVKVNGKIVGCALSIIIDSQKFDEQHTYREVTGNYLFDTHTAKGDILYGIDVFVKPEFRGLRIGRRMYDYRKDLCEKLNLKGIVFGGRIPNYHKYADALSPKEYIEKVRSREIQDPVLNFQLSNDFHPVKVLKAYLEGDAASNEYAVLLRWNNIYYEKPTTTAQIDKTVIRIGVIQWQMRSYRNIDDLMLQAEYFIDTLSTYKSDFALFPEFFNAPLMAEYNDLNEAEAIRKLAKLHTASCRSFWKTGDFVQY